MSQLSYGATASILAPSTTGYRLFGYGEGGGDAIDKILGNKASRRPKSRLSMIYSTLRFPMPYYLPLLPNSPSISYLFSSKWMRCLFSSYSRAYLGTIPSEPSY